jgi:hypothetical protein
MDQHHMPVRIHPPTPPSRAKIVSQQSYDINPLASRRTSTWTTASEENDLKYMEDYEEIRSHTLRIAVWIYWEIDEKPCLTSLIAYALCPSLPN